MVNEEVCFDLYTAYPVSRVVPGLSPHVGVGALLLGFAYLLSAALTVLWVRRQQRSAQQGMSGAALHVIFPIYLPFMWLSALSDCLLAALLFFFELRLRGGNGWRESVFAGLAFSFQHLVVEGIAFLLMQYGCGLQAVRSACWWASGWAVACFVVQLVVYREGESDLAFYAALAWNLAQLVFYGVLWLAPEKKLFRRDAVRRYACFWACLRAVVTVSELLFHASSAASVHASSSSQRALAAANCLLALVTVPVVLLFKPLVIYRALLRDSVWWQGLSLRSETLGLAQSTQTHAEVHLPSFQRAYIAEKGRAKDTLRATFEKLFAESVTHTHTTPAHNAQHASQSVYATCVGCVGALWRALCALCACVCSVCHTTRTHNDELDRDHERGDDVYTPLTHNAHASSLSPHARGQSALQGPLQGVEVGFSDAQELAREVDNIHAQGRIRLLNFAFLSLDSAPPAGPHSSHGNGTGSSSNSNSSSSRAKERLLGAGSFSKVYRGQYKGEPVAVKMLFTQDLNPDVIRRCSNEARILSELAHSPHVVRIFGAAVLPPSVCIVLEICEYGSLSDVLRGAVSPTTGATRPPLRLTMADRMYLAYGCAQGLSALHSYSPLLCHRDIKSFNFLVDAQLRAKIADLDLGEQTDCARANNNNNEDDNHADGSRSNNDGSANNNSDYLSFSGKASLSNNNNNNGSNSNKNNRRKEMCRSDMNITWQAPEALLGLEYTQRSDVHSLALVLWEIIAAGRTARKTSGSSNSGASPVNSVSYASVPYADCKSQEAIREKIVRGVRPPISSFVDLNGRRDVAVGGADRGYVVDPLYVGVMTRAWSADPQNRPTAAEIAVVLRKCWLNTVHRFIWQTSCLVDIEKVQRENFRLALQEDSSPRPTQSPAPLPLSSSSKKKSMFSPFSPTSVPPAPSQSQRNSCIMRHVPSAEVMETLSRMQSEPRWAKLEQDAATHATTSYLVLSAQRPFYMLWASRRWTQLTGYLVHDIIAYEVAALFGAHTQTAQRVESLCESVVASQGVRAPQHTVISLPRRDGQETTLSMHVFPVFESANAHIHSQSLTNTPNPAFMLTPSALTPLSQYNTPKSPISNFSNAWNSPKPPDFQNPPAPVVLYGEESAEPSVCSDSTADELHGSERAYSLSAPSVAPSVALSAAPQRTVAYLVLHFSAFTD